MNLGLRYEFRRPPVDKRDSLVTMVPTGAPFSGSGNALLVTAAEDSINHSYCTDPYYSYLLNLDGSCSVATSSERAQMGFNGRMRRSLVKTYKNNWAAPDRDGASPAWRAALEDARGPRSRTAPAGATGGLALYQTILNK